MPADSVLLPVFSDAVPIVFGADEGFFVPLVVSIQSIISNASDLKCYDIIILANKFGKNYSSLLYSMANGKDNISIRIYDVEPFLKKWDLSRLKTGHRLSLATYYRLFIPELMKGYKKIIYIDGDTVVLEDISILYGYNLENNYAAAVKDYNIIRDMSVSFRYHVHYLLQMKNADCYFNAGVLLLDLDLIRRDFSLAFFMEQAELKGAKHHDQDVLNSLFYEHVLFLPPRYNSMWQDEGLYAEVEGGRDAVERPAIVHYPGGGKPWLKAGAFRPAARHFWKYALTCPYAERIVALCKEDCARSVEEYSGQRRRFWWYLLLARLLFGRKRRHYAAKVARLRESLCETEKLMR